jgi:hypothetical protein
VNINTNLCFHFHAEVTTLYKYKYIYVCVCVCILPDLLVATPSQRMDGDNHKIRQSDDAVTTSAY